MKSSEAEQLLKALVERQAELASETEARAQAESAAAKAAEQIKALTADLEAAKAAARSSLADEAEEPTQVDEPRRSP